MSNLIGRKSVDINLRDLQDNHIPIYDKERGVWTTLPTGSIIASASSVQFDDIQNKPPLISGSAQVVSAIQGQDIAPSTVTTNALLLNTQSSSTIISSSVKTNIFDSTEIIDPPFNVTAYSGVLVEYVAQRQEGVRTGMLYGSWSGSTITYTDVSNTDVGDTSDLSFNFIRVADDILLRAYSVGSGSGAWTVQCLFKMFPNLL